MERFVQIREIAASCAGALLAMTVVCAIKDSFERKEDGI